MKITITAPSQPVAAAVEMRSNSFSNPSTGDEISSNDGDDDNNNDKKQHKMKLKTHSG